MIYFKFSIAEAIRSGKDKPCGYPPTWFGEMTWPPLPATVEVLLYNDAEGYGIARTENKAIEGCAERKECEIICEADALDIVGKADATHEQIFTSDKIAHRWDTPQIPETIKPDPHINHNGENCIMDDKRTCQDGFCNDCWLGRERMATPAVYSGTMAYWCNECGKAYTVEYNLPLGLKAANINLGMKCPQGHKRTVSIKSSTAVEEIK